MEGWFQLRTDAHKSLLRMTMGGFFDSAAVTRLRMALGEAIRKLGCAPNQHVTLCDITAMNIQSQEVVAQFALLVGRPETRSRKLAFVTGATLARLQARRLTRRPNVEFFSDERASLAWLMADAPREEARTTVAS